MDAKRSLGGIVCSSYEKLKLLDLKKEAAKKMAIDTADVRLFDSVCMTRIRCKKNRNRVSVHEMSIESKKSKKGGRQ